VLINADMELAHRAGADGVHLTSAQLRLSDALPAFDLVAASCHDVRELVLAAALGADFAVLGPVKPTQSHPQATLLGMPGLARLLAGYSLPTYAIGGLSRDDLETVWTCGAHGIAMQRAVW
jgi:8-oxo-dGTP diphosphatase